MTATIDAKGFATAIAWAMGAVPTKSTIPVLGAVPLTVTEGEFTASGFDFTSHASATVPADGELLTVHVLGAMVAKIAPQLTGTVTLVDDGTRLRITSGRDKYTLPIVPAEDYPHAPPMPPSVGDSAGFIDAFTRVAPSAATPAETGRPILQNVHVVAEDGTLTARATNRYRMSIATIPWDGADFATIVPARAVTDFGKAIGGARIALHVSDSRFGMTSGGYSVSSLLADGEYPTAAFDMIAKARQVALTDDGGVLVAPRSELLGAVKRAAVALGPNDPLALRLSEDDGCSAIAVGQDGEASAAIIGSYLGPDLDAHVTAAYLLSLIEATPAAYIALGASQASRMHIHVVGCPDDSGATDDAIQHIVMARKAPSTVTP